MRLKSVKNTKNERVPSRKNSVITLGNKEAAGFSLLIYFDAWFP